MSDNVSGTVEDDRGEESGESRGANVELKLMFRQHRHLIPLPCLNSPLLPDSSS